MRRILFVLAALMMPAALAADASAQPPAEHNTIDEAPAEEAAETATEATAAASEPDLLSLLGHSTEDQRARMLRFIRNRYPGLTTDMLALLQSREPGIFVALDVELETLIATRYPRLKVEVQRVLQQAINDHYPQVRKEITELIARDYPDVVEAMREMGLGDPATNAARVIRERHQALLSDVRDLLREEHPGLLREVQREVVVKHPELLADVAEVISRRYPALSAEMTEALTERYPELIPGILEILAQPADEDEPAEQ